MQGIVSGQALPTRPSRGHGPCPKVRRIAVLLDDTDCRAAP